MPNGEERSGPRKWPSILASGGKLGGKLLGLRPGMILIVG